MDLNNFVENTLGSWDVQELLCIKRVRLKFLIDSGKLKPMKVLKGETLFWKPDVMALRNELMKNVRSNLYKLEEKKHA